MSERTGIVEHGLFLGLATDVIVATGQVIRHLKRDALMVRQAHHNGLSKKGERDGRD
jgi:hypothetical protein